MSENPPRSNPEHSDAEFEDIPLNGTEVVPEKPIEHLQAEIVENPESIGVDEHMLLEKTPVPPQMQENQVIEYGESSRSVIQKEDFAMHPKSLEEVRSNLEKHKDNAESNSLEKNVTIDNEKKESSNVSGKKSNTLSNKAKKPGSKSGSFGMGAAKTVGWGVAGLAGLGVAGWATSGAASALVLHTPVLVSAGALAGLSGSTLVIPGLVGLGFGIFALRNAWMDRTLLTNDFKNVASRLFRGKAASGGGAHAAPAKAKKKDDHAPAAHH